MGHGQPLSFTALYLWRLKAIAAFGQSGNPCFACRGYPDIITVSKVCGAFRIAVLRSEIQEAHQH